MNNVSIINCTTHNEKLGQKPPNFCYHQYVIRAIRPVADTCCGMRIFFGSNSYTLHKFHYVYVGRRFNAIKNYRRNKSTID